MAKLDRKDIKIFADDNTNDEIVQFGSTRQGTPVPSKDPDVLQSLSNILEGWKQGVIASTGVPPFEEFNTLQYLATRELAYIQQAGIQEYSATTNYYAGKSIVRSPETSTLYISLTDDNLGNPLTDIVNWKELGDLEVLKQNKKNLIINGDFEIAQRGTSFTSVTTATYNLDRWQYNKSGSMVHDVSQDTDTPTVAEAGRYIPNSMLINCTTADASIDVSDFTTIRQKIEGYNFQQIAQKVFTVSFWVKATKTGVYCLSFNNSGLDRSYVSEYTIDATDTWEFKTITVIASPSAGTWNYENGTGIQLDWSLAAGTNFHTTADAWQAGNFLATSNQVNACDAVNNEFRLAGVQVEAGSVATEFEQRSISKELILCQRYYEKSYDFGVNPGTATGNGSSAYTNQSGQGNLHTTSFSIKKRATPSIVSYSTNTGAASKIYVSAGSDVASSVSSVGFGAFHNRPATSTVLAELFYQWTADAEL